MIVCFAIYYFISTWLPKRPVQGEGAHLHAKVLDTYDHEVMFMGEDMLHNVDGEWTKTTPSNGRLHTMLDLPFDRIHVSGDRICVARDHLRCGFISKQDKFVTADENESIISKDIYPIPNDLYLTSIYPWSIHNKKGEIVSGNFNSRPLRNPTNWVDFDGENYLFAATYDDNSVFLDKQRTVFIKVCKKTFCPTFYSEPVCLDTGCKPMQEVTSLLMLDNELKMTLRFVNNTTTIVTLQTDVLSPILI